MTKLYDTLAKKHKKQADAVLKHRDTILEGTLLAIDPGSKAMGWAIFEKGELADCGTALADNSPIGVRLKAIHDNLPDTTPDVVAVEFVRSSTGHHFLGWSNGAVIARYGPSVVVEIDAYLWKKLVASDYVKSDVRDAKSIGNLVITLCLEDLEHEGDSSR